jgi:hypothetical protein
MRLAEEHHAKQDHALGALDHTFDLHKADFLKGGEMRQIPPAVIVCILALAGCVQSPVREFEDIKPTDSGFVATVGVNKNRTLVNDRDAEAKRVEALQDWTSEAGICPSGFEIVDRAVIRRLGYEYWISYTGRCL